MAAISLEGDSDGGVFPSQLSTCCMEISKKGDFLYFRVHSWLELLSIVPSVVIDSISSIFRHDPLNAGRFRKEKI